MKKARRVKKQTVSLTPTVGAITGLASRTPDRTVQDRNSSRVLPRDTVKSLRGQVHMMSAMGGVRGGPPKADELREVA